MVRALRGDWHPISVSKPTMTRLLPALVLGLALTASPAHAAVFTLDSYTVTLRDIDPGLVLWENDLPGAPGTPGDPNAPATFELNAVGDVYETSLFRLGTNETALNWDDLMPYSIAVDFDFSTPLPGFQGDAQGMTGAGWFFGDFGYAVWDNPLLLDFNGGQLAVSLSNVAFALPGYSDVTARFKLTRLDSGVTAVPEPASLALFGIGAAAMAACRRRRAARAQ